jgi:hypothetical protein
MTPENFTPFGSELQDRSTSQFVRIAGPENPMKEAPPEIAPVTPAEDNDLPSQIHQILQNHLSGDSLKNASDAIESVISAAPARVALPEIKLIASPTPEDDEDESTSITPPVLEYEREDDVVRRVIVNCSCGQSIHLDCDY